MDKKSEEVNAVIEEDESIFYGSVIEALRARGLRFVRALPIPVQGINPDYISANHLKKSLTALEDSTITYKDFLIF